MSNALPFGPWLKQRRRRLDLTQEELARRAICSLSTLRKIESEDLLPSRQLAQALATALQVPLDEQAAFVNFARSPLQTAVSTAFVHHSLDVAQAQRLLPALHAPLPASLPPASPVLPVALPAAAALLSLPARKYRLPAQLTALVGREWELLMGGELLRRPDVRLVTLSGPPGTGKTRLALALAESVQAGFGEGACFVPLAPISDPAHLVHAIAKALQVPLTGDQMALPVVQEFLSEKALLLVIDNFEQLVSAADQLIELLQSAPGVKMVVTSRTLLKVYGEYEFPVAPLVLPTGKSLPAVEELKLYSAVALFVQRAQAVQPSFRLTAENAASVVQLCNRLDGLPLAIEMAAARSKLYSPASLLNQLRGQVADLATAVRNREPRQQTLRSAVAWSYNLLQSAEQALFDLLGLFVGGCTAKMVAEIQRRRSLASLPLEKVPASEGEVLALLQSLVDQSLLNPLPQSDGTLRYTLLETIREFASERLQQTGAWYEARLAHAATFCDFAESIQARLSGSDQALCFRLLEQEHDNLRAALQWAHEQNAVLGLRIAVALSEFWYSQGYLVEGSDHFVRLLAQLPPQQDPALRAKALCAGGYLVERQGNHHQAQTMLEESLQLFQHLNEPTGIAKVLHSLGIVAYYQTDYAAAQKLYAAALAIYEPLGDLAAMVNVLRNQGWIAKDQGDYGLARHYFEQGLTLAQQLNDPFMIARYTYSLANIAYWQGEYDSAAELSEKSHLLLQQLADKSGVAYALDILGSALYKRGKFDAAREVLNHCIQLFQEIGDKVGLLVALDDLGLLEAAQGQREEALRCHRQSLGLGWQVKEKRRIAFSVEGIAAQLAEPAQSVTLYSAAAALRRQIGAPLPPIDQQENENALATLRSQLGEDAFQTAWQAGQSLALDEVIRLAT